MRKGGEKILCLLTTIQLVKIQNQLIKMMNLKNDSIPYPKGGEFSIEFQMRHRIHCIKILR